MNTSPLTTLCESVIAASEKMPNGVITLVAYDRAERKLRIEIACTDPQPEAYEPCDETLRTMADAYPFIRDMRTAAPALARAVMAVQRVMADNIRRVENLEPVSAANLLIELEQAIHDAVGGVK